MPKPEYDVPALAQIHAGANAIKLRAYFTGYLEGIVANGLMERGEGRALIANAEIYLSRSDDVATAMLLADLRAGHRDPAALRALIAARLQALPDHCSAAARARFAGLCAGVACDGRLNPAELRAIADLGQALPDWQEDPCARELIGLCATAEDRVAAGREIDHRIMTAISRIAGDSFAATGLPEIAVSVAVEEWIIEDPRLLGGASFVLTGSFTVKPRSHFAKALEALGMVERGSVNWRTDYLVIGGQASRDWLEPNRGNKIRSALFYKARGAPIRLVTEAQLQLLISDRMAS